MPEIYPEHHYDKDGYLKPPKPYYLAILYLLRGYIIITLASSYGANTQAILTVFYPQTIFLYAHLIIGVPAILAWALVSNRARLRKTEKPNPLRFVKPLLIIGLLLDLALHIYVADIQRWAFNWTIAISLMVSVFILLWLRKAALIE